MVKAPRSEREAAAEKRQGLEGTREGRRSPEDWGVFWRKAEWQFDVGSRCELDGSVYLTAAPQRWTQVMCMFSGDGFRRSGLSGCCSFCSVGVSANCGKRLHKRLANVLISWPQEGIQTKDEIWFSYRWCLLNQSFLSETSQCPYVFCYSHTSSVVIWDCASVVTTSSAALYTTKC